MYDSGQNDCFCFGLGDSTHCYFTQYYFNTPGCQSMKTQHIAAMEGSKRTGLAIEDSTETVACSVTTYWIKSNTNSNFKFRSSSVQTPSHSRFKRFQYWCHPNLNLIWEKNHASTTSRFNPVRHHEDIMVLPYLKRVESKSLKSLGSF